MRNIRDFWAHKCLLVKELARLNLDHRLSLFLVVPGPKVFTVMDNYVYRMGSLATLIDSGLAQNFWPIQTVLDITKAFHLCLWSLLSLEVSLLECPMVQSRGWCLDVCFV